MGIGDKTSGFFIIGGHAVALEPGQIVSFRDDTVIEEFQTRAEMEAEYLRRYPELYVENEETP